MGAVFVGASALGLRCCESLLEEGKAIDHVFTMPREFEVHGRHGTRVVSNVLHADFTVLEDRFGVPVTLVEGGMGQYLAQLEAIQPSILVVVGWYHLIPKAIMRLPRHGAVGVHASLLPKYRGNAPLVWAVIEGERETGVSLFHFDDGIDSGDLVDQRRFAIDPADTIREVLAKAEGASVDLLCEHFDALVDGTAPRRPQNEEDATSFPPRTPQDGEIDWSWTADRIRNFVRAQTRPYPGAFTVIDGRRVTLWDIEIED